MSGFRRHGEGASGRFSPHEASLLARLTTQLAALLAERGDPGDDPAIDRLLPEAYRDNDEHAAEFRRFTEDDLSDAKISSALAVAATIEEHLGGRTVTIELDAAAAVSWLRTLTDIRLALAVRLGVGEDGLPTTRGEGEDEEAHANFAIYYWLGALQESLVLAVDR